MIKIYEKSHFNYNLLAECADMEEAKVVLFAHLHKKFNRWCDDGYFFCENEAKKYMAKSILITEHVCYFDDKEKIAKYEKIVGRKKLEKEITDSAREIEKTQKTLNDFQALLAEMGGE